MKNARFVRAFLFCRNEKGELRRTIHDSDKMDFMSP